MRPGARSLFPFLALFILILTVGCGNLFAQATSTSALQGTIFDPSHAVIPGAAVELTSKATGATRTAASNDAGIYRFDFAPAGFYSIKVTAQGFSTGVADNLELLVGKTTDLDFTLQVRAQAETVTVSTEAPIVSSEQTHVGLNITPTEIQNLPLNGRDFANLAYLAPGAKPVNSYDPTKNRYAIFGINGSSGRNVNVTVNGIDNKDNTVGGPVMQLPLEAVQEFVISTQRFSAANGRSEGAAINVVTKSGSNDFHGDAYLLERNERLNAQNFFETTKSPFSRQQFGGAFGGPLRKEKDFFFFTLERQREITNIVVTPDALKELQLVTTLAGPSYSLAGAQPSATIPTPYFDWRYNGRFDHRFSNAHSMFASYAAQSNRDLNDQSGGRNDLTGGNFTKNELQIANATFNSVLTPRVINSFTLGFQYWNNLIDSEKKVPTVYFGTGAGQIYFGTNTNVPQQSYQRKWQFKDDLSIVRGKHALKTGFDYLWEPKLGGFFEFNPTLEIDFIDLPSKILSDKATYPQGFNSPGAVGGMSATSGNPYFDLPGGSKMFGVYFQDDWKVTRNFTLNLGLRWDKDFNLVGTDAQPRNRVYLALKAIGNPYASALPHDDNKDFSPRLGFAYDVTGSGRHVVRGGYGLYFGQIFLNIPLFMIQQINPTIFATVLAISSSGPTDTGADPVPGAGKLLSQWRFGVDPLPVIPPPPTQLPNGSSGRIMDPFYRNPYTQQWNIGYAYKVTNASVIEVEYVHVLGLHESRRININPNRVTNPANPNAPKLGARPLTAAFRAAGLPILGPITNDESTGRSRYDGLNISYRQRMTHRVSLNANYVLSRALAYNGNVAAFGNRATDIDDGFAKHDFGPAPNDETHRWALGAVGDLPWGFQVSPVLQLATARPYNTDEGIDVFGYGSGRVNAHAIVLNSSPNDLQATKSFTAAQLRACLADNTCHQVPFNFVRGQTFFQLDARVSKIIKLGEHPYLKLIFQAFDLTNRANFGNRFGGNIRLSNFRQPIDFITPSGVIVPRSFSGEIGVEFHF